MFKKLHVEQLMDEMLSDTETETDEVVFKAPANCLGKRKTNDKEFVEPKSEVFPKVKIRTDRRTLNEDVMRCAVKFMADYKVSLEDLAGIIVNTANIIFHQEWKKESEFNVTDVNEEDST